MTIAATRTRELNIGQICLRSYQLIGLVNEAQSLSEAKLQFARDQLQTIIDELQAHGLRARAVEFRDVTLVADTSAYTMATDVLDVVGDAMFIDPTQTSPAISEVPLTMIDRAQWQLLSNKSATGRPMMYYVHRTGSPPEVRLWPIPDANNAGTVRFQIHRLAADSNDTSKTPDLERFFVGYLEWELGHQLAAANSLNMSRVQYFGQIAQQKLSMCKSYSAQKSPAQLVLRHRTGWSR